MRIQMLTNNQPAAYQNHVELDKLITSLGNSKIKQLLDPSNIACQLLLAHFVTLYLVIEPIACRKQKQYIVKIIYNNLPADYRKILI